MENQILKFLPLGLSFLFSDLRFTTSKLQRTAGNVGFISKCLRQRLTPTLAKVKGNFKNDKDRFSGVKKILNSELREQQQNLKILSNSYSQLRDKITTKYGRGAFKFTQKFVHSFLTKERRSSLATKTKKINFMMSRVNKNNKDDYQAPIINLTNFEIPATATAQLKFGLQQSFVDKNKQTKIFIAAEFERLAYTVDSSVPNEQKDNFHHYLRSCVQRLSQNVFNTSDNTWKSLQKLTSNPDIVVLQGDKDSSVVIMPKTSYNEKLQEMINDGIANGKYQRTSDNTIQDLQSFQSFLYRNFKNCKNEHFFYSDVRPTSNKPAALFATAKTHKFADFKNITTENLKLRPIISTCGTYYYQSAKSLAKYLGPLAENEYTIKDTLEFPDRLKDRTLDEDEVLVSYDVSSLFTEVPLEETIDYIIHQIYSENKLPHLSNKRIFKRLL